MQAIMCTDDVGVLDPTTLIPVEIGTNLPTFRTVTSLSLVELGKELLCSAERGDTEQVRVLMGKGAPFTTDWLGTSPLHLAAQNGHVETAEILLRAGISRDARTKVEKTPLHIAAQEGHLDIVELLLNAGAEVDARDMLKMTPLHWAVDRGHLKTVQLLLRHGANPNCLSKFEKTAFSIAIDINRVDILEQLQSPDNPILRSAEQATLAATESITMEMAQVPAATHQEEVETSATAAAAAAAAAAEEVSAHVTAEQLHIPSRYHTVFSKKHKEDTISADSVPDQSTIDILQAHGITMLPADDSSLVATAVERGHTVVLTEAGKMALDLTNSGTKKKLIIRTNQMVPGRSPNILKRPSDAPPKFVIKSARTAPVMKPTNVPVASAAEIAAITKQLEEARREAEEYKQLLSKKSQEAEQYRQQLQSFAQQAK